MSGRIAAQIARDAATSQSGYYYDLSGKMCWDAVVFCMVQAGAPDPGSITSHGFNHVVSTGDPAVNSSADMRHVPQGAFIGFFDGERLIHAMIATGHGLAAGNKNACIGIGGPVGWEILDVAGRLHWTGAGVSAEGRALTVHYRAMD